VKKTGQSRRKTIIISQWSVSIVRKEDISRMTVTRRKEPNNIRKETAKIMCLWNWFINFKLITGEVMSLGDGKCSVTRKRIVVIDKLLNRYCIDRE